MASFSHAVKVFGKFFGFGGFSSGFFGRCIRMFCGKLCFLPPLVAGVTFAKLLVPVASGVANSFSST